MKKIKLIFVFFLTLMIYIFVMALSCIGRINDLKGVPEVFSVLSEDNQWGDVSKLNIFNNNFSESNAGEKIIYPGSRGIYKFVVQNNKNSDVDYQVIFSDDYNIPISIKYNFMSEDDYVLGKYSDWVEVNQLKKSGVISAHSKKSYVLEWFWEDGEEDSYIGFEGGYYTLNIEVIGESM